MKRAFDLVFSALGLLVLWPLFALLMIAILLLDGRPVFFRQERVGQRGRLFRIWKFRTMVPPAELDQQQLTVGADPRITWLGRWLRKTKLDELPQLFNVLAGEMSFVGPRPEVPRYVTQYTSQERAVLELMPGITDAASIRFRRESELLARARDPEQLYRETIVPEKIRINLEYAQHANMLNDLAIIGRTLRCLAFPRRIRDRDGSHDHPSTRGGRPSSQRAA